MTSLLLTLFVRIVRTDFAKSSGLFDVYYANFSTKLVKRNFKPHNPNFPILIGNVEDDDVNEVSEHSYIDLQQKLF